MVCRDVTKKRRNIEIIKDFETEINVCHFQVRRQYRFSNFSVIELQTDKHYQPFYNIQDQDILICLLRCNNCYNTRVNCSSDTGYYTCTNYRMGLAASQNTIVYTVFQTHYVITSTIRVSWMRPIKADLGFRSEEVVYTTYVVFVNAT